MKRILLLPLLLGLTSPVNAESVWLIMYSSFKDGNSFEKVQMKNMEQCNEQGQKILFKKGKGIRHSTYVCITGK